MALLNDERNRAYIYRLALAVLPLLVLYGVISESDAATWAGVLAGVLGIGEAALATRFTSTQPVEDDHSEV